MVGQHLELTTVQFRGFISLTASWLSWNQTCSNNCRHTQTHTRARTHTLSRKKRGQHQVFFFFCRTSLLTSQSPFGSTDTTSSSRDEHRQKLETFLPRNTSLWQSLSSYNQFKGTICATKYSGLSKHYTAWHFPENKLDNEHFHPWWLWMHMLSTRY